MNILKITKKKFLQIEALRKQQISDLENAVLCSCDKCRGVGFVDKSVINTIDGIYCLCGGRNRKVDKVEII